MRRYWLMAVLLILSFQFVWAAAASYCRHEARPAKQFGQHDHMHESALAGLDDDGNEPSSPLADGDCTFCNFSTSPVISTDAGLPHAMLMFPPQSQRPLHYKSYIPP